MTIESNQRKRTTTPWDMIFQSFRQLESVRKAGPLQQPLAPALALGGCGWLRQGTGRPVIEQAEREPEFIGQ